MHNQQNKSSIEQQIRKAGAFIAVLGLFFASLNIPPSYAWITDENYVFFELESAKVHYEVTAEGITGLMVPGKNFLSKIEVRNKSTADSDLRMQIIYDVCTRASIGAVTTTHAGYYMENASPAGAQPDQYLNVSLDKTKFTYKTSDAATTATFPSEHHWWYYNTSVPAVATQNAVTGELIPAFINSPLIFNYDGPRTTNVFAGQKVKVTVRFQAKQHDYVTWADIGTIEAYIP